MAAQNYVEQILENEKSQKIVQCLKVFLDTPENEQSAQSMESAFTILMQYRVADIALYLEGQNQPQVSNENPGQLLKLPDSTLARLVRLLFVSLWDIKLNFAAANIHSFRLQTFPEGRVGCPHSRTAKVAGKPRRPTAAFRNHRRSK